MNSNEVDLSQLNHQSWRVIHLRTGEFLLVTNAARSMLNKNYITITHPIKIILVPDENGVAVGMLKWNPHTNDEEFNINLEAVLTVSHMNPETVGWYTQALAVEAETKKEEAAKEAQSVITSNSESELKVPTTEIAISMKDRVRGMMRGRKKEEPVLDTSPLSEVILPEPKFLDNDSVEDEITNLESPDTDAQINYAELEEDEDGDEPPNGS